MACLRCVCKRPGEMASSPAHRQSTNLNTSNTGFQEAANEKEQWWSGNGSQLNNSSDPNPRVDDEGFPEIIPLRKGVNRLVVSTRKTPLERRLANAQAQRDLVNNDASGGNAPFVPLPPNMFATKPQDDVKEAWQNGDSHGSQGNTMPGPGYTFGNNEADRPSEKLQLSERPVSLTEGRDNNDQTEKSERWFKRVSELHEVTDLSSAIPDEDFPELMPMRKGENCFVISKEKDRSLTTPLNKRRASMEQPSESKFVPFVPFPPDYFAKKDQSPSEDLKSSQQSTNDTQNSDNVSSVSSYGEIKTHTDGSNRSLSLNNPAQCNWGTNNNWSSVKTSVNDTQDFNGAYGMRSSSSQTNVYKDSDADSQKQNTTYKDGWSGKSLEGSAVTDIDPLDMSEEAKAERWFRRAAQIKDISELSQIPDEDFPAMMPMRKGVNRFVVSKRKTPLERRLTSPQYRRNLPIVESDPPKTPNESS